MLNFRRVNNHTGVPHLALPLIDQAVSVKGRVGLALDFDLTKTPACQLSVFIGGDFSDKKIMKRLPSLKLT